MKSLDQLRSYSGNIEVSAAGAATQDLLATGNVVAATAISAQPVSATVCSGTNTSFSVTASGDNLTYQWQVSTDGTNFSNIANTGVYSGANASVLRLSSGINASFSGYKYRCIVSGSCGSSVTSSEATLTISAPVSVSSSPFSATICAGITTSFSVTASGAGLTYQWRVSTNNGTSYSNISADATYSGDNTSTLTITGATTNMNGYLYQCLITGTCTSASSEAAALTVNAAPATPGTISGNSTICANTNQSYSVAPVSGATSYSWILPAGWLGSSTASSINVVNSSTAGHVEVRAQNSCGNSAYQTLNVAVSGIYEPTLDFTVNNQEQCLASNSFSFTNGSSAASGTTITSNLWNFGDGSSTSTDASPTKTYSAVGRYIVRLDITASNGCASSLAKEVIVNGAPTGQISGGATICSGSSTSLPITLTGTGPWLLDYTNAPSPVTINTSAYQLSVSPASTTTFIITSLSDAKCPAVAGGLTGSAVVTVQSNLTPTVSISSNDADNSICTGASVTFSSSGANLGAGPTYQWLKNGTAISGAITSSYTTNSLSNNDAITLQVISSETGCLSTSTAFSNEIVTRVQPAAPTTPLAISGAATQCVGLNSQSYSIASVLNATSYTWTVPTGWTIASGAGTTSILANVGATTGTVEVKVLATNSCGSSTEQILPVTVNNAGNNPITRTSALGTDAQTVCINTPITNITYSSSGGTGASFSGLPTGVSGAYSGGTITISGTPTQAGAFGFTVTLTGAGCNYTSTGTITVSAVNTILLSSAVSTNAQTLCISSPLTNITYATTGATGASVAGLPSGINGLFDANAVTISGTPTASGSFNYTINLTGGCGSVTETGTITVTPVKAISLSSASGTNTQTVCVNTAITNITYASNGATNAIFTGLPTGVTGTYNQNGTITITGSPSIGGTYPYTVTLTGGCGTASASGTIATKTADEWTSNGNSEVFHNPSNWCRSTLPGSNATIIIPTVVAGNRFPRLSGSDAAVGNIELQTDATLDLNGRKLVVNGAISGNGVLVGGTGTVLEISGSGNGGTLFLDQTNDASRTIGTLKMNRSAQELILGNDLIVGTLDLTAGNLNTGNNTVEINQASNASASSFIKTGGTGKVKRAITNGQSFSFPVGNTAYNPVTITNNTGTGDDFTVNVVDDVYYNYTQGVGSNIMTTNPRVKRTWNIGKTNPTANANNGIDFTFNWNNDEVVGPISQHALYHYENGTWTKQTGTTTVSGNTLTYTAYKGSFSPFAIGDATTPLPVTWLSFTGKKLAQGIELNWSTSSEQNTKDFQVQHSINAQQWSAVGTLPAAGNSNTVRNYRFLHEGPFKNSIQHYYRILQRDLDEKFSYSKVIRIEYPEATASVVVYPNPASDVLHINLTERQELRLVNMQGVVVWKAVLAAGRHEIPVANYASGAYVLQTEKGAYKVILK